MTLSVSSCRLKSKPLSLPLACTGEGNTLQLTVIHCNILRHTALHCDALRHIAIHCNTLEYTARHCNTLLSLPISLSRARALSLSLSYTHAELETVKARKRKKLNEEEEACGASLCFTPSFPIPPPSPLRRQLLLSHHTDDVPHQSPLT